MIWIIYKALFDSAENNEILKIASDRYKFFNNIANVSTFKKKTISIWLLISFNRHSLKCFQDQERDERFFLTNAFIGYFSNNWKVEYLITLCLTKLTHTSKSIRVTNNLADLKSALASFKIGGNRLE